MVQVENHRNVLSVEATFKVIAKLTNQNTISDFGDLQVNDQIKVIIKRTKTNIKKIRNSEQLIGTFLVFKGSKVLKKLQYDYFKFKRYFVEKQLFELYDDKAISESQCNYVIEFVN